MTNRTTAISKLTAIAALAGIGAAMSTPVRAADMPDAVTASPDVYSVVAENEFVRVIEAVWQPGQRDEMHAHPPIGVYFLSACDDMRVHFADGSAADWNANPGEALANGPVEAHSIENVGNTECRLVFVEPK